MLSVGHLFSSEEWKCLLSSVSGYLLKLFGGSVLKDSAEYFFSSKYDSSSLIPFVDKNLELILGYWSPFSVKGENVVLSFDLRLLLKAFWWTSL